MREDRPARRVDECRPSWWRAVKRAAVVNRWAGWSAPARAGVGRRPGKYDPRNWLQACGINSYQSTMIYNIFQRSNTAIHFVLFYIPHFPSKNRTMPSPSSMRHGFRKQKRAKGWGANLSKMPLDKFPHLGNQLPHILYEFNRQVTRPPVKPIRRPEGAVIIHPPPDPAQGK